MQQQKWRQREVAAVTMKRKGLAQARGLDFVQNIETLDKQHRADAIVKAGISAWEKAAMRATIRGFQKLNHSDASGGAGVANLVAAGWEAMERSQWDKDEIEAQMAEMALEKEEAEAMQAELIYDKKEREALAAEQIMRKEEAEAQQAVANAAREEEEAIAAIADADREEKEAVIAEQQAEVEMMEAEVARCDAEREVAEAQQAAAHADKEMLDVLQAQQDLADAQADFEVAKAINDADGILEAEERVLMARSNLGQEEKEAVLAKQVAVREQAEAVEAVKVAEREKGEALDAIAKAQNERLEANEAVSNAMREKAEASEAKVVAEREMAEFLYAKTVATRDRMVADEAKTRAQKERREADDARKKASKDRAEANAAKEEYLRKRAQAQADLWITRSQKSAQKRVRKLKRSSSLNAPVSTAGQSVLGAMPVEVAQFETSFEIYNRNPLPEAQLLERGARLQAMRQEYARTLAAVVDTASPARGSGSLQRLELAAPVSTAAVYSEPLNLPNLPNLPALGAEDRHTVQAYGLSPRGIVSRDTSATSVCSSSTQADTTTSMGGRSWQSRVSRRSCGTTRTVRRAGGGARASERARTAGENSSLTTVLARARDDALAAAPAVAATSQDSVLRQAALLSAFERAEAARTQSGLRPLAARVWREHTSPPVSPRHVQPSPPVSPRHPVGGQTSPRIWVGNIK
jgi:chemotaxis protein histidine kinase CheA